MDNRPAAWHPDPLERHELRYWDGDKWTEHVSNEGVTTADPLDEDATDAAPPDGAMQAPAATPSASAPPTRAGDAKGQFDQALATVTRQASNRIATSAMIVGIIGLVFSVIPLVGAVAGYPLGGYAVVAGIIGILISKKSGHGRGASIAGMVLGGLAVVIATIQIVVLGRLADDYTRMLDDLFGTF